MSYSIHPLYRESKIPTYARMGAAMATARPTVFTQSNTEGVERVSKVRTGRTWIIVEGGPVMDSLDLRASKWMSKKGLSGYRYIGEGVQGWDWLDMSPLKRMPKKGTGWTARPWRGCPR